MVLEFVKCFGSLCRHSGVCVVILEFMKCFGSLRCDSGSLRSGFGVCEVNIKSK